MPHNPAIPTSVLYGFLLVLARISGVFVFLPLPGFQAGPSAAKITLSMILTFGMYSRWPALDPLPTSMLQVAGWMVAEAAIGLATGLAVAFLIEAVTFAAQAISTQAGFAYASTIDPNTEADSTVLLLLAQLTAGLLFFAYQRNPRLAFIPIFRKLAANDALSRFTTHTASSIVAIPPAASRPGQFVGQQLLEA